MDDKGDPSSDEMPKTIKPTSKEFRKTWGFRRTMIAKREGVGDAEVDSLEQQLQQQQQQSLSLRHSGKQPKRTKRVEEFLTTVRCRGRRNIPVSLEDSSEPTSCPVMDAETVSEGSIESASEMKSSPKSGSTCVKEQPASSENAEGGDDNDDASDSDSNGLTSKELPNRLQRKREQEPTDRPLRVIQSRLRKKRREEDPAKTVDAEAVHAMENSLPGKQEPETSQAAVSQAAKDKESRLEGKASEAVKEEEPGGTIRHKCDCEVYDANTLYCLCWQPHNNRFMICCDRCEEWFHGDCVGISEARGRLLKRNGEDYVCPNCTILQVQDEVNSENTDQQDTKFSPGNADGTEFTSIGTVKQKSSEDQRIKGRIEKAAHPRGKKKFKIFQPVTVLPTEVIEAPRASKCVGPGCSHVARPDSVYCSNDCIVKHAAATMKFLNSGKEQKPKRKEKTKMKSEKAGIKISSMCKRAAPDKKNIVKKTVVASSKNEALIKETTPESAPSWAGDHNYNAVQPEKTAAPSPSLLYKSMKEDKRAKEKMTASVAVSKKMVPSGAIASKPSSSLPRKLVPKKSPSFAYMSAAKQAMKKSPLGFKGSIPKRLWLTAPLSGSIPTAKQSGLMPVAAVSSSKKLPGPPALGGVLRKPAAASISAATAVPGRLMATGPALSQPNSKIRQNIRHSLKEILWKRVSDSDDLIMTENGVRKIALRIEKEMFNLFQVADNRYKSRYRSIVFNLKDPTNQGLFHRVLRGEVSLAKLVRMKPEELVSKELSMWKERPAKSVMESRNKLHKGSRKTAIKQETIPDMEDSPMVSDLDEQQESVQAIPEKRSAPLVDVFSSMLKDKTSQHRAHLFDLNCRICTGQIPSEDEPAPKKQRLSASTKREDPKSKYDSSLSEPVLNAAKEVMPGTLPSIASEPEVESASHPNLGRNYFPVTPGSSTPEPSPLRELPPCPASCGGGVLTTVTVTGRDPRTASRASCAATAPPAAPRPSSSLGGTHVAATRQDAPKPPLTSVPMPKSILVKPFSSRDPRYLSLPPAPSISISESRSPPEGDTTLFLSHLNTIWKGFINMQSVAKFVVKAYPVSGCFDYLTEDLPEVIHIGGRISPKTVWDYVGKLKSSVSKELCLIRFHPATEEEEVAYVSLYSYFSSRGRFGVVANNNRHVKDLYLIPLSAKDPIPFKLLPFKGPGLESPRPNIILGLVICQKLKHPSSAGQFDKIEEKRNRLQTQEVGAAAYPKVTAAPQSVQKPSKYQLFSADATARSTPLGLLLSLPPLPEPPAVPASVSVLKNLSSLRPRATSTVTASTASMAVTGAATSATSSASKMASPLEHILRTLFGEKKSFDPTAKHSAESSAASHPEAKTKAHDGVSANLLLDPIVQQFGYFSKEKAVEEEEDDRPYDPEEEYNPDRDFNTPLLERGKCGDIEKAPEPAKKEDVAYDPEDEIVLEEAKVAIDDLHNRMRADAKNHSTERSAEYAADITTPSLVEQQRMLVELSQQIEEQKRQLEEQEEALRQQRAAMGASMAHFSVSEAIMSPPPKASLTKMELFQPEPQIPDKPTLLPSSSPATQGAQPISDPRLSRDPWQAWKLAAESSEAGELKPLATNSHSALPSWDTPGGANTAQLPLLAQEKWELVPPQWVTGEKGPPLSKHSGQQSKHWEDIATQLPESAHLLVAGDSAPRPVQKVLLPTPPNTTLQPNCPLHSDGQSFSDPGGREPFWSTVITYQEKSLSLSQFEDPRNLQFLEKTDSPAIGAQGNRAQQYTQGEGASAFTPTTQKGVGPQPQFQEQQEAAPLPFPPVLHGPSFPAPRGLAPPFSKENLVSNHKCPRRPLPPRFGTQKGPVPYLFPGQHGPPPFGENWGPSPSYLRGPRAGAPSQFEECKDPRGEKREFQELPYAELPCPPANFEGPEQAQFVGNLGSRHFQFGAQRKPQLSHFNGPRGPPPSQCGGQRELSPGHFGHPGQFDTTRGPHPYQFEGLRGQAPNFMPGPRGIQPQEFEVPRVNSPLRFARQRAPAPLPFAGPRGSTPFSEKNEQPPSQFHFQGQPPRGDEAWPMAAAGAPQPPTATPEGALGRRGPAASLPTGTPGLGSKANPPWLPPDFPEGRGHEYRNQAFKVRPQERFEAGPKEKLRDEPKAQTADGHLGRVCEERRHVREHGRGWGHEWDWERNRDKDASREWDQPKDKAASRDKVWEAERAKESDWSQERSRNWDRWCDRDRSQSRELDREPARDKDRDPREQGRDRKDRSKSKESGRDPKAEGPWAPVAGSAPPAQA